MNGGICIAPIWTLSLSDGQQSVLHLTDKDYEKTVVEIMPGGE